MDKGKLEALLERVEKARGADREIDEALMSIVYTRDERHIGAYMENDFGRDEPVKDKVWVDPQTDKWVSTHPHEFTRSIDAALAFVERVLPGWVWNVGGCQPEFLTDNDRPMGAELHGPVSWEVKDPCMGEEPIFDSHWSTAPTAPLAILAALLKALIARADA